LSRKGCGRGVLLDTSFLLPFLGFTTRRDVMEAIPLLRGCRVYYSELSILEALWKAVKLVRSGRDVDVVVRGVELVRSSFEQAPVTGEAVETAMKMYALGHRDMVDNLLYGTARALGLRLLTVDRELARFVREKGLEPSILMEPSELRRGAA